MKAVLALVVDGAFIAVNGEALQRAVDDTVFHSPVAVHNLEVWLAERQLEPERFLNRHAILHGGHLHYHTEANSLRAFLLLDALAHPYIEGLADGSKVNEDRGVFRTFFEDLLLPHPDFDDDETEEASVDNSVERDQHDEDTEH